MSLFKVCMSDGLLLVFCSVFSLHFLESKILISIK
ncbi:unnamed protein product [Brassica rapa]|uniref:Uncharacterized protein n=2 Tax=Brassica TaxID=3705 RepID=A0A8D9DMZ6_BRACM|nr:unnamed protein product [Brassica napus]CAG7879251.1 unnamed protein product [Brassica rapa]